MRHPHSLTPRFRDGRFADVRIGNVHVGLAVIGMCDPRTSTTTTRRATFIPQSENQQRNVLAHCRRRFLPADPHYVDVSNDGKVEQFEVTK